MELEKLNDLYDILGVDFGSSDEEINQQYYKRISYFKSKLKKNGKFSENEKLQIKALKTSKYILTDPELREKYNFSKIIDSSDKPNSDSKNSLSHYEYTNLVDTDNLKNKPINYDVISARQFERYDPGFDVAKDRELRSSVPKKDKSN